MYYIYILYTKVADKYYVGYSKNPWERVKQHNINTGDKFTGKYKGCELVAVFQVSEKESEAVRMEKFIKQQKSRKLIEKLINPNFILEGKFAQLDRVPYVRD